MTASRACNYLQNAAATTYKKFLQFYAKRSCKKHSFMVVFISDVFSLSGVFFFTIELFCIPTKFPIRINETITTIIAIPFLFFICYRLLLYCFGIFILIIIMIPVSKNSRIAMSCFMSFAIIMICSSKKTRSTFSYFMP